MNVRHVISKLGKNSYNCPLTSALMMILSKEAFLDTPSYDTSQVAAQIVSGISL